MKGFHFLCKIFFFCTWLCFIAGCFLWGNSLLSENVRFLSHRVQMIAVSNAYRPQEIWVREKQLRNHANLGTELRAWPKKPGRSGHLHKKGFKYLWNFNNVLDNTYRFLVHLDSHRINAGTQFTSLVLALPFLLLVSILASEPFLLWSPRTKFR